MTTTHAQASRMPVRRVNAGLLQGVEQPALAWLAARVPPRFGPDHLTLLGLGGAFLVLAGYVLTNWSAAFLWLANLGLVVNWLGDSLDGTLARSRKIERPQYGQFVDHATDLLSQALILFGLGLSPYVRFDVACVALVAYLALAVVTFLRRSISGVLQISFAGLGPTEMRALLVLLNAALFFIPPWPVAFLGLVLSSADVAVLAASACMLAVLVGFTVREAQRIGREDPRPRT
jgi:phosphatidylglycerophosphate synthase